MHHKPAILLSFLLPLSGAFADTNSIHSTKRVPQFTTDQVRVWETLIYPSSHQILKMHRHEYDRVVVAFDSGTLKVMNNKGKFHFLKLKKNKSYYLTKDIPNEMHTDENLSRHPIQVLVIELKNTRKHS